MSLKDVVAKIRDRLIRNEQEPIVTNEAIYIEVIKLESPRFLNGGVCQFAYSIYDKPL